MQELPQALHALLLPAFSAWGSPVTWAEIAAFAAGIGMVLCNLRVNPWGWPLAILSSMLYALLFLDARLHGQALLQLFFVAISLWGWRQWLRGGSGEAAALRVARMSIRSQAVAAAATLAAWPLLALALDSGTSSAWPWLDALPTVASVTAQVLLARKRLENWPLWLAVNLLSMVLFALQGLWLTVLLYAVFAALSVAGWRAWSRLVQRQPA